MKKEFTFRLAIVCLIVILIYEFGIGPTIGGNKKNSEWAKGKITAEQGMYDVVVVGEEPEGIAAAVSAARAGAKTLLAAQSDNLGGVIAQSLLTDLETSQGPKGELLNKGFYSELYSRLGKNFTTARYLSVVNSITNKEKNLEILYSVKVQAPVLEDNIIKGVSTVIDGKRRDLSGKIFIDATREGDLLTACGVPYFKGSEDLNLKKSFSPAYLNFVVEGISSSQISQVKKLPEFFSKIHKYQISQINAVIKNIDITPHGSNKAVIRGIEVWGVNADDKKAVDAVYREAANEASIFTDFLKKEFKEFEGIKFLGAANRMYMRESTHFIGEYMLSVNDILDNRDFSDKIAVGSHPVDASKFVRGSSYIIGKPVIYSIPLGCIVPLKVDNLLMVGSKASFSSLAASSAGVLSVGIAMGQAAGIISVYSIIKDIAPRDLVRQKNADIEKEIQNLLKEQGLYLPKQESKSKNQDEWSYPYIRQLINLGLIAGGTENDFRTEKPASQEEFAMLLLNGIYRLAPEKYSLELDARIRKYFKQNSLSKEKAGEVLLALYNKSFKAGYAYIEACKYGYIDNIMQQRLKKNSEIRMEDVFYLSCYNIKKFTGKRILEE
ncbi:MAG: FAD-dependent oxidoreductase [Clostridia bacterium]|nr:FAD-dependent oxidoreductase [Clostridia bacterium]